MMVVASLFFRRGMCHAKVTKGYVHVTIDQSSAVKAHAYFVNGQIGRLVDNWSLQSKVFCYNFHAPKSFEKHSLAGYSCKYDPEACEYGTKNARRSEIHAGIRVVGSQGCKNGSNDGEKH